ncbi:hypothetical protein [Jannaschia pohangensis]|uniref:Uncharacterized protein n=1 Tax=Jannaschia pohangensis TaxID=390807 RepID=A0A1I3QBL5_9RHOB|nr:hypothetical protein [Jannaschia pohangensis]SFJ31288.1 hypothetical protein SAMN04488095_2481 [Jannaschia pohangensis]
MKLSVKKIFARAFRETKVRPLPGLPTEDDMYLAHMRRKADDAPRSHGNYERRIF